MDTHPHVASSDAIVKSNAPHAERDVRKILALKSSELEKLMREGAAPQLDDLAGWEFAGTNLGALTDLLRIRKFKKGFYRGPSRSKRETKGEHIQGYNVIVRQNGIGNPHHAHPNEDEPKRHGFYRVHRVVPGARDSKYENALILDYGLGKNGMNPAGFLRDYLVQPYPDDPDLLLGKAYAAVAGLRIPVGFFVLVRHNRASFGG